MNDNVESLVKHKLIEKFKQYYDLVLIDFKLSFDEVLNEAIDLIDTDLNDDAYRLLIETAQRKRKNKRYRIAEKITSGCNVESGLYHKSIHDNAYYIVNNQYKDNQTKLLEDFPNLKEGEDIISHVKEKLYKDIIKWKNDSNSLFIDFHYLKDVLTKNLLYKTILEDMVFFSYKILLNKIKDKTTSYPYDIIDIPKTINLRNRKETTSQTEIYETSLNKIEYIQSSLEDSENMLLMSNYLVPKEYNNQLTSDLLNKEISNSLKDVISTRLNNIHIEAMANIFSEISITDNQSEVISFPLKSLTKKLYKRINNESLSQTQNILLYLATIKVRKFKKTKNKRLEGYMFGFLSNIAFYYNMDNELIVSTSIDSFLKKQVIEDMAIKLDSNIKNKLDDDFASALAVPFQTLRLKNYFYTISKSPRPIKDSAIEYLDDNIIIIPLEWFKSLCITSFKKPSVFLKRVTQALDNYIKNDVLIDSYRNNTTTIEVKLKLMNNNEFSSFNYSKANEKALIEFLQSSTIF